MTNSDNSNGNSSGIGNHGKTRDRPLDSRETKEQPKEGVLHFSHEINFCPHFFEIIEMAFFFGRPFFISTPACFVVSKIFNNLIFLFSQRLKKTHISSQPFLIGYL